MFTNFLKKLTILEYRVLETALIILVLLNGTSIISRYLFNHAIGELFEIMVLGSVAIYWLAIATAQREQAHIGVGFAVSVFPPRVRIVVGIVRLTVICGFLLVVFFSGVELTIAQFRSAGSSGLLNMPLWLFSMFMPLGGMLMLARVLRQHFSQQQMEADVE